MDKKAMDELRDRFLLLSKRATAYSEALAVAMQDDAAYPLRGQLSRLFADAQDEMEEAMAELQEAERAAKQHAEA